MIREWEGQSDWIGSKRIPRDRFARASIMFSSTGLIFSRVALRLYAQRQENTVILIGHLPVNLCNGRLNEIPVLVPESYLAVKFTHSDSCARAKFVFYFILVKRIIGRRRGFRKTPTTQIPCTGLMALLRSLWVKRRGSYCFPLSSGMDGE